MKVLPLGVASLALALVTNPAQGHPAATTDADALSSDEESSSSSSSRKDQCRLRRSRDVCGRPRGDLPLCVGIRGNGNRIWAHFPSLARIVETFGPIFGVAGGSSATATSLLLESIESNPLVTSCSGRCCRLKSVQGLPLDNVVVGPSLQVVIEEAEAQNIPARLQSGEQQAVADFISILESTQGNVATLVNRDVIELLLTSPDPLFHADDIIANSQGDFSVSDPLVFVRPYLLDISGAAALLDLVASFYAGFEPLDTERMERLLEDCAKPSLGVQWNSTIMDYPTRSKSTCGNELASLFDDFVESRRGSDSFPSRLDDDLGGTLRTMITTSVLQGNGVDIWKQAVDDYENIQFPVRFPIDFDSDVRFGYFGDKRSLRRASKRLQRRFSDAKSSRFISLGPTTWREVMIRSPAEPTLSRGVPIGEDFISLGGWTDPVPSQILDAIGCNRIVLVNRPDGTGTFPVEIATQLGATEEFLQELYQVTASDSSWTTALREADASICSDWDAPAGDDANALSQAGYDAPLLSQNECIVSNTEAVNLPIGGCTPLEDVEGQFGSQS